MKLVQLAIASVFAVSIVPFSSIADNTGTINFVGTVVNTPCNIEQSSLKQTIDFGQLSRSSLESGNAAEVDFDIKFNGCDLANFEKDDTGAAVAVKSMELVFTGQNYANQENTLLATSTGNDNNLGIAIHGFEFGEKKDILSLMNNQTGNNTLTFKALAKAIDSGKNVTEGQFSAISNFRITYQ